ncbi:Biopolymer transport protein ExbD [Lacunisphaera limnophila]|uniref:Biopolymer transport protein ExbD n=1 Tax=Lacunisphaera limnophila TaxID=1838286 RepID=A0A1D8AY62_9BACT|nr:biopolymer transporter ExbD [Lacunisphaera limnophila]AOS45825.1 Biopolymer transport protein ExbD [Lacunisphaera limnophila]
MARTFKRQRQTHPISELNVTNLIDVAFTLLIIFMIATPLIQQEQTIPVNLPGESKREQQKPPSDTTFVAISIDRSGNYYYGSERMSLPEISRQLMAEAAKSKQPVIRIRADLTLQWQQVVRVMDEVKRHNLTKITFDTEAN